MNHMRLKTHLIAMHPNNKQATLLAKHCGYARVARNYALSEFKDNLHNGEFLSDMDLRKSFNAVKDFLFPWCRELSQNASKNAICNLGDAVKRWLDKSLPNKFPRYRNRSGKTSYQADNGAGSVQVQGKRIKLPRIGWIRLRETLRWKGEIRRVTVSKRAGRWFVSVLVKVGNIPALQGKCLAATSGFVRPTTADRFPIVGVDVGIKTLAVTSDGRAFANPKALYRYLRKLRRAQRALSRSEYQSNRWYRKLLQVQKLHYRIACIREDLHHKASTAIVKSASVIGIESLRVLGLLKNRRLSKALSDAALSGFLTMLRYKAAAYGVQIIEAPTNFPSSKQCSSCGHKKKTLSLSERTYHCEACGFVMDRDLNAAHNLRTLAASSVERLNGHGARVSPHSHQVSPGAEAVRDELATTTAKSGQIMIDYARLA